MKKLLLGVLVLNLINQSCNNKQPATYTGDAILQALPDSSSGRYLDSITWVIEKSIPVHLNGHKIPEKTPYREEYPFFDSAGSLMKYAIFEQSGDTSFLIDYYYYYGQLIKVDIYKNTSKNALGAGYYIFKNGRLINSDIVNLERISPHILLKQASFYMKKSETGSR